MKILLLVDDYLPSTKFDIPADYDPCAGDMHIDSEIDNYSIESF